MRGTVYRPYAQIVDFVNGMPESWDGLNGITKWERDHKGTAQQAWRVSDVAVDLPLLHHLLGAGIVKRCDQHRYLLADLLAAKARFFESSQEFGESLAQMGARAAV